METIEISFAWRGVLRVGFDLFRLREGTAGALEGEWRRPLPADVEREVECRVGCAASVDWATPGEIRLWRSGTGPVRVEPRVLPGDESGSKSLEYLHGMRVDLLAGVHALLNDAIRRRIQTIVVSGWFRSTPEAPWLRIPASEPELKRARGGDWAWLDGQWLPKEIRIELHFPFLDRHSSKEWDEWKWNAQALLDERGRILLSNPELYQGEILMGGAIRERRNGTPANHEIVFCDVRQSTWSKAREQVSAMLTACKFPPLEERGNGPVEVAWTYSISGAAAHAWLTVHQARSDEMAFALKKISSAVQSALRLWMPYQYFDDLKNYEDREFAWPMLVYGSMPIFETRNKYEYTYEILSPQPIFAAMRFANMRLKARLRTGIATMELSREKRLSVRYTIRLSKRLLREMDRMPKYFGMLLTTEGFLVKTLQKYWLKAQRFSTEMDSNPEAVPKNVCRAARHHVAEIESRLRRMYGAFSLAPLTSLVWVVATWALAKALGQTWKMEAVLRLKDISNGEEIFYVNEIFFEKFYRRRELYHHEQHVEISGGDPDDGIPWDGGGSPGEEGDDGGPGTTEFEDDGYGDGEGDPGEVLKIEDIRGEVPGEGAGRSGDDRGKDQRDPEKGNGYTPGEAGGREVRQEQH